MGSKSTDSSPLFALGDEFRIFYGDQFNSYEDKYNKFYQDAMPYRDAAMANNTALMGLMNQQAGLANQMYGAMPGYTSGQSALAGQQAALSQRQGAFMDAQQAAMSQALGQASTGQQQAQNAYGDYQGLMNEYNSTYRPANAKLINDAMNFNTAAYRENLAQQAAADAGRAFNTTMGANARQQASMGVNPNSGRFQAQQNQNALALAAGRANAMTDTRRQAEQEGVARLTNAVNSKGGAHLLDAAGSMFNAGTNAMNSATSALNAGVSAGNSLLDAGNQAANNAYSAYNSLMGNAIHSGQLANQSAGMSSGLGTNNFNLYNGYDQQYLDNMLQALNIYTQGINAQMGLYGQGVGVNAQNNANQNAFTNGLIGMGGQAIGGGFGTMLGAAMFSDRRLKQDIERVGTYDNGLPMYEFAYRDAPERRYRGVMADDVLKIRPEAVIVAADGYQRVNYALLGITLEAVA